MEKAGCAKPEALTLATRVQKPRGRQKDSRSLYRCLACTAYRRRIQDLLTALTAYRNVHCSIFRPI